VNAWVVVARGIRQITARKRGLIVVRRLEGGVTGVNTVLFMLNDYFVRAGRSVETVSIVWSVQHKREGGARLN
jgi:hypothetical protein